MLEVCMKPDKTLESLKALKEELWCECIGNCICSCEPQKAALTHAIEVFEGDKGLESILSNQAGIDGHKRIPIDQASALIKSQYIKRSDLSDELDKIFAKEINLFTHRAIAKIAQAIHDLWGKK